MSGVSGPENRAGIKTYIHDRKYTHMYIYEHVYKPFVIFKN
jgi:hypothetical protein